MATLIDISKKCHGTCTCYINQEKDITAKREDNVTQLDKYGHCTHNAGSKQLALYWKTIKLETTSGISFTKLQAVTTYYHKQYELGSSIGKPLLIRVKEGNDEHWYENAGHHAHKKWRRINEGQSYKFLPSGSKYLKDKLQALACSLYGYHQVDIYYGSAYIYRCPICKKRVNGNISEEKAPNGITGYTRYKHSNINENSVLVYNGNKLVYRNQPKGGKAHYLQIPVDPYNYSYIGVYYWDGDNDRKNPLIIEIGVKNGTGSFWFENIGQPGTKHEKWRPLHKGDTLQNLQNILDVLNCLFNRVVQIKFGVTGCHNPKYVTLHKTRIKSFYNGVIYNLPGFAVHEYTSTDDFKDKPFNISKFILEGRDHTFPKDDLPFRDVIKLSAYESSCDNGKPFLICLEFHGNNESNWYFRERSGDSWKEYGTFRNQKPGDVGNKIDSELKQIRAELKINACSSRVLSDGINLGIKITPQSGHATMYSSRQTSIIVVKDLDNPVEGFFRNTHRPGKTELFTVNKKLIDGDSIGSSPKGIIDVKDFFVYFWHGAPNTPILLGVNQKDQTETKYYGKSSNHVGLTWMTEQVRDLEEQQALDHQNCQLNDAIPIELTKPEDFQPFHLGKLKSKCLSTKYLSKIPSGSLPHGAKKDYKIEGYQVNGKTRISRVTYGDKPTNILPPYTEYGPTFNIYHWTRNSGVPLLVEFKSSTGDSTWYENLGGTPPYTNWKRVDEKEVKGFYKDKNPKNDLTDKFTDKLNEVNCRVNKVLKLDISRTGWRYCNSKCKDKRIRVRRTEERIRDYTSYEHVPIIPNEKTFTISSIVSWNIEQKTDINFPLEKVEKVTVYFADCNPYAPILVKIEDGTNRWLKRKRENDGWEDASGNNNFADQSYIRGILEELKGNLYICAKSVTPPFPNGDQNYGQVQLSSANHWDNDDQNNNFGSIDDADVEESEDEGGYYEREDGDVSLLVPTIKALKSTSGIIIDIKRNISEKQNGYGTYIPRDGLPISLEKSEDPKGSGFFKFKHTSATGTSGEPFKVEKVIYGDSGPTVDVGVNGNNNNIKHLSVWYWDVDGNMNNPLFIEVRKDDGKYDYYFNKGQYTWSPGQRYRNEPITSEALEKELDDLNCRLNQAVTMDLSESRKNGQYCCNKRISISHNFGKTDKSDSMEYYVHSITQGSQLAKIKYYASSDTIRKRINADEIEFPITGSVSVSAFYCGGNPVLIYVKGNGHNGTNKWYKRKNNNDHESKWELVQSDLKNIQPGDVSNPECEKKNKLVTVLKTIGCNIENCVRQISSGSSQTSVQIQAVGQSQPLMSNPPQLTIELKQKPENDGPIYYPDSIRRIKVTRSSYPPDKGSTANFYEYKHEDNSGKEFPVKEIKDDAYQKIPGILEEGQDVTSVSAYYWRHESVSPGKKPKTALLVKVLKKAPNGNKYYSKNKGRWNEYQLRVSSDDNPSQAELEVLNCEINDVVQIDVTKTGGEYCHSGDKHLGNRVKVKVSDGGKLGNYTAYAHSPSNGGRFNISEFKNGGTSITLSGMRQPIMGANKVTVYFCKSEVNGGTTADNPLLIYVPDSPTGKSWFKKPESNVASIVPIWKEVNDFNERKESDYEAIVKVLDTLASNCKPPSVTIDIYNRSEIGQYTIYGGNSSNVYITPNYSIAGFTDSTYKVYGRKYFTLQNVNYEGIHTSGIVNGTSTEFVTSVSVLYWTTLESRPKGPTDQRGRPLLVKITRHNTDGVQSADLYYENIGKDGDFYWQTSTIDTEDKLREKLHLLNCLLNGVVTLDLSYDVSKRKGKWYCCTYHNGSSTKKIYAKEVNVSCQTHQNQTSLATYRHFMGVESKLAGIKYNEDEQGQVKNITFKGLSFPIFDVQTVCAFYCNNNPVLIYIEGGTSGGSDATGWYKQRPSSDIWEEAPDNLNGIKPSNFSNLTCKNGFNALVDELKGFDGCKYLKKCFDPESQDTPPSAPPAVEPNPPPAASQESDSTAESPKPPAAFAGGVAATGSVLWTAFGSTSGTLAGSAATFFGGWKLYNRYRGDPWVRQI
ncbi:hypothetical protein BEWA_026040 [Theileria equi strain WA]|uniref:Uncharacterized protein n=1 Tax=Theileria equi strain WA TaxID=1537102 RepID=L0AW26_THEEQ|nr:hypothetical protein BEWA_026040 [Theileria equi strain WA]AFZ79755.1 hypothetical protein BEWA_026040 [Theileria equi strain WA]|eukprot:XP_004829421.1 hypothetical protein BEWA_026040 [Theileria equi strain WA]